ncbi:MAG: hypothetical protein LBN27_02240 [Prevotellaceae bacterium]|jgi:histone deacetylase complex regulatory component SIN3|nr:hypothetical protein [Prevotellaceae bacterium]
MKKIIIIFAIIGLFCSKSILKAEIIPENNKYKVEKINIEETAYVIDLSRNDTLYKVLTEAKPNPLKLKSVLYPEKPMECKTELIEVGKFYDLKLDTLFYYQVKNYTAADIQYGIEFNGTNIYISFATLRTLSYTLYTTKSLKGLCFYWTD